MISICLMLAAEQPDRSELSLLEDHIEATVAGDPEAFATLYEKTNAAVYGFSLSILKHAQDAEDVLQDTFLHIYSAAGKYEKKGSPMPWIFTIARNLCLMRLRANHRTEELPEDRGEAVDPEDTFSSLEDRQVLKAAMTLLSSEERQVIMLHAVGGLKHREIAELLQIPLSTALSRYHRSLQKMRQALKERAAPHGGNRPCAKEELL